VGRAEKEKERAGGRAGPKKRVHGGRESGTVGGTKDGEQGWEEAGGRHVGGGGKQVRVRVREGRVGGHKGNGRGGVVGGRGGVGARERILG